MSRKNYGFLEKLAKTLPPTCIRDSYLYDDRNGDLFERKNLCALWRRKGSCTECTREMKPRVECNWSCKISEQLFGSWQLKANEICFENARFRNSSQFLSRILRRNLFYLHKKRSELLHVLHFIIVRFCADGRIPPEKEWRIICHCSPKLQILVNNCKAILCPEAKIIITKKGKSVQLNDDEESNGWHRKRHRRRRKSWKG